MFKINSLKMFKNNEVPEDVQNQWSFSEMSRINSSRNDEKGEECPESIFLKSKKSQVQNL